MTDSTERLSQIDQRLEQLGSEIADFRERLQEQTASVLTLQQLGGQLLEIVRIQQQRAEADRQQVAADREEFRQEIRQIWEYLLQQRPNGNQG